jgi:tRNA 5-methylaminomethyl-2-thiouridine biosynthesis bifunctional protein
MTARHVVLDTAFGDGARFAAARAAGHARLHYLAITPRVPAAAQVAALDADAPLRALWPPDLPGFHRIVLDEGRVTLDLLVGEVSAVLPQIVARVQHFHLAEVDAAPAADLRAYATLARALARLAAPHATLAARAPAEALVWALTAAGFVCRLAVDGACAGDAIDAVYRGRKTVPVQPMPTAAASSSASSSSMRRAVVIGAGLAGAAVCRRLCASGWDVTLIERHQAPAHEASGNLAGIFMPLLSKDDNIPTRLARAAYLFALREWRRLGGVGTAFMGADCGVLQLARDAGHARVQQAVLDAWHYPPEYVRWADAGEAGALLGGPTPHGGWLFPQGGWARPSSLCAAMLDACGPRLQRLFCAEALTLHREATGEREGAGNRAGSGDWLVRGAGGTLLARAPTVILANGAGAVAIEQAAQLPLQALRGQVTHLAVGAGAPQLPLVVCREAYVTPACDGIVCAGATYDNDGDPQLRLDSQRENLARLAEIVPGAQVAALADSAPLAGRVGFRCAAPDRLPLAGALPDYSAAGRLEQLADVPRHAGLYGLLGYASRGLIWAPLMAELLVSQLDNTPPPLEAALVDALDPGRFLLKQRRRAQ